MSMTASGGVATSRIVGKRASAVTPRHRARVGPSGAVTLDLAPGEGTGAACRARPILVLTRSVAAPGRGLATLGAGLAAGAAGAALGGAAPGAVARITRVGAGGVAGGAAVRGATAAADAGAARALVRVRLAAVAQDRDEQVAQQVDPVEQLVLATERVVDVVAEQAAQHAAENPVAAGAVATGAAVGRSPAATTTVGRRVCAASVSPARMGGERHGRTTQHSGGRHGSDAHHAHESYPPFQTG